MYRKITLSLVLVGITVGVAIWISGNHMSAAAADCLSDGTPTVVTDKLDYEPGETVVMNGEGFQCGAALKVTVTWPPEDGRVDSAAVIADGDGKFTHNYELGLDAISGAYTVAVIDSEGNVLASTVFHDTHFRFGHIIWNHVSGNTVEFEIILGFRRSFPFDCQNGNLGDLCSFGISGRLNFGDSDSVIPTYTIIGVDVANDWVLARASVQHTYPNSGPFTAFNGTFCCRISPPRHINNPDQPWRVEATVDLRGGNTGNPQSLLPAIVDCPQNALCQFLIAGFDPDGQTLRWRLSMPSEWAVSNQPGPPHASNAASVDSSTGIYSWDTAGATLNPNGETLYSTQVTIEDVDSNGNVISKSAIDFFIRLVPPSPDRDIVFIRGIDSEGNCDRAEAWVEEYLNSSTGKAFFDSKRVAEYLHFNYSGGGNYNCPRTQPAYTESDTCDGVANAAQELRALIDNQATDKVTILAHSMGGLISAYLVGTNDIWAKSHIASVVTFDSPLRGAPDQNLDFLTIPSLCPRETGSIADMEEDSNVVQNAARAAGIVPFYPLDATQDDIALLNIEFVPRQFTSINLARPFNLINACFQPGANLNSCEPPRPVNDGHTSVWACQFDGSVSANCPTMGVDKAFLVGCAIIVALDCTFLTTPVSESVITETLITIVSPATIARFTSSFGSIVRMELISPDGTVYGPDGEGPVLSYRVDEFSETYIIGNPATGDWTIRLFGVEVAPEGEDVLLTLLLDEAVRQLHPEFDVPPTPQIGSTVTIAPDRTLNLDIQASDGDTNEVVSLNAIGAPLAFGATFSSTPGNPAIGAFVWTPGVSDVGTHLVVFVATDEGGRAAPPHTVFIEVLEPKPVGGTTLFLVDGSDSSAGGIAALVGVFVGASAILAVGGWYTRRRWLKRPS